MTNSDDISVASDSISDLDSAKFLASAYARLQEELGKVIVGQERQVTVGSRTLTLPEPFFVLATQNPIEQEGTYPLPEAQLDRFMFMVTVHYPSRDEELEILKRTTGAAAEAVSRVIAGPEI